MTKDTKGALTNLSIQAAEIKNKINCLIGDALKTNGVSHHSQAIFELPKVRDYFADLADCFSDLAAGRIDGFDPDGESYRSATLAMNSRVKDAVIKSGQSKWVVCYSAFNLNEFDLPIDNLDDIAVRGRVRLVGKSDPYSGGKPKSFRSKQIVSPTWLQVAVEANRMLLATRGRLCNLEGLSVLPKGRQIEPGVTLYEFLIG